MRAAAVLFGWLALAGCGRLSFDARDPTGASVDAADARVMVDCAQSNGLVGYWSFDENGGSVAADQSRSHQDATLTGNATWTGGSIGSALRFDGTTDFAYMGTPGLGFSSGTGSFSLSYWVSPLSLTNTANDVRPFEIALCNGNGAIIVFIGPDGSSNVAAVDNQGHTRNAPSLPGVIQVGRWTHVAHVLDRSSAMGQTYIDGIPSGAPGDLSGLTGLVDCSVANESSFGGWRYGANFWYAGSLDDVRIYDRALSPSEVQDLSHLTASGCPW